MKDAIVIFLEKAKQMLSGADDLDSLRDAEIKILGRKQGELHHIFQKLKNLPEKERKEMGKKINEIKQEIESLLDKKRAELENQSFTNQLASESIDITERAITQKIVGHAHPISQAQEELVDIFISMGFTVYDGPDLESDYYNFEALNIPKHHPARDNQDTFYIKGHSEWLMRTHTSPEVQVRVQELYKKPIRAITSGRCYRNEATDASHEHTFYQLDGAIIDKDISIAHLKALLLEMFKKYFKKSDVNVRLRPGYFPFVEPGMELDLSCIFCNQKGCRVCKYTGWVEMLGCGLLHPNVIQHAGFDPKKYSGCAFGMGIDRIVMLKYEVHDIRLMHSGDIRFLEQF